jgi:hypothetical protein
MTVEEVWSAVDNDEHGLPDYIIDGPSNSALSPLTALSVLSYTLGETKRDGVTVLFAIPPNANFHSESSLSRLLVPTLV